MRGIHATCCLAGALMLGLLVTGCSSSKSSADKQYADPKLAPAESAVVKSSGGIKVVSVDGYHVPGSEMQMASFGGNKVVLTPGTHRIVARRAVSGTPITYHGHEVVAEVREFVEL